MCHGLHHISTIYCITNLWLLRHRRWRIGKRALWTTLNVLARNEMRAKTLLTKCKQCKRPDYGKRRLPHQGVPVLPRFLATQCDVAALVCVFFAATKQSVCTRSSSTGALSLQSGQLRTAIASVNFTSPSTLASTANRTLYTLNGPGHRSVRRIPA